MTLFRQLILATLGLLVLLYAGNVVVSMLNARTLVQQQMAVHAQDTATSVALSMTQAAQDNDIASLETLFNAISDSGFYQRIYFRDLDGNMVVERAFSVDIEGVPDWFVNMMDLPSPQGQAEVAAGWARLGEVVVLSHPGQAYRQLWEVVMQQLAWFGLILLAVSGIAYGALNWLLAPLRRVEEQANSIREQKFVVQETLPNTRELHRVVDAMNRMSNKLHSVFDEQTDLISHLRVQSYRDDVTGLSNRADFDARLNSFVGGESGDHSGALMIFAIADFARVNELAGRQEGNEVLKSFGAKLKQGVAQFPRAALARRQGPEFCLFVPDVTEEEGIALGEEVFQDVQIFNWSLKDQESLTVNMGFTYTQRVVNGPELLSEADMALRHAVTEGQNKWGQFAELKSGDVPLVAQPAVEWKDFIARVIGERALVLHYQNVVSTPDKHSIGCEVFTRFRDQDGNLLSAGIVLPLAERFGRAPELDQLILETLAEEGCEQYAFYGVNLCASSITSSAFTEWLKDFLKANKGLAKKLVFEVSEHILHIEEQDIRSFQTMLHKFSAGLAIDRFGLESAAFGYLSSLPLRYLKVHRSFVQNIQDSKDNQFYVKSLAQLAHSREVMLIVEGVEQEAEWQVLARMGIDAAQGYLLGKPEPLPGRE